MLAKNQKFIRSLVLLVLRGEVLLGMVTHFSPTDTKFTEDYNGTNFYHDGFFHYVTKEVVKEWSIIVSRGSLMEQ